ncbi:fimbrial protein, partial [Pseudomonas lactis]|uniref:fimbrial protein n=1 Tax=Pseudomonas lactis TaxID=1615674 RepID=UPI0039B011BB
MKKIALAVALLMANSVVALPAFAADGTITLTGEITGTTCSISGGAGAAPGARAGLGHAPQQGPGRARPARLLSPHEA